MVDSAIPYVATIQGINLTNRRITILYQADSTYADSNRPDLVKSFVMPASTFTDSGITNQIKAGGAQIGLRWKSIAEDAQEADSIGFNDSDYIGRVYNYTYKPSTSDSLPVEYVDYNPQVNKAVPYDSEGPDEIRTKYNIVALSGTERREYREGFDIQRVSLWIKLLQAGSFDSVQQQLGTGDDVSASWDASAGAAFDWSTDKIHGNGVRTVTRQSVGTYRVYLSSPMPSSTYTVVTGVGDENYGGTGASPRQLSVISANMTDSYFEVHCERTDDAVDEDNAYMSVQVSRPGAQMDSEEIEWMTSDTVSFGSVLAKELKTILGYSADSNGDSDFVSFLRT